MNEPWCLAAPEIARRVRRQELRAVEILEGLQRLLEESSPWRSAFARLEPEAARRRAEEIDRRCAAGDPVGELAGVPFAVKDNLSIAGRPLTCGSRILEGFRSTYTATAVSRILAAGAVLVGQTKLDEFAMGSSGEHGLGGTEATPENPWHGERVPGGSSSGSAVAVAHGLALALGSDTGGSIRQPASFCGVVGLRPSYGRVSRRGLVAFASTMDQIGPLARDVPTAAAALRLMAGVDRYDASSSGHPVTDFSVGLDEGIKGLRFGVPAQIETFDLEPEARAAWRRGLEVLSSLGAERVDISLPPLEQMAACYSVLAAVEASSNLARFDGVRYGLRAASGDLPDLYVRSRTEGFGAEVARRLVLGTYLLGTEGLASSASRHSRPDGDELDRARELRRRFSVELTDVFRSVQVWVTPTTAGGAFRKGEKFHDPVAMYLTDAFTVPASLAGLPALTVPTDLDGDGLPLSMQIVGRRFDEATVLRVGRALEQAVSFDAHRQAWPSGAGRSRVAGESRPS